MSDSEKPDELSTDALLIWFRHLTEKARGPGPAARALGVPKTTFDQWFNGKSRIPLEPTFRLAKLTGSSVDQMLYGQFEAVIPGGALFLKSDRNIPNGFVSVPMLDVRASAGAGALAIQNEPGTSIVAFEEEWLRKLGLIPGRADAITAVGDSMEPTIRDGDLLLVDRSVDRIVDHGIYIVVVDGVVLVKRVQKRLDGSLTLISDNSIYREEVVPKNGVAELIIEGRVRWFGRMI